MKTTKLKVIKLSQPDRKGIAWRFSGGKVDVRNVTLPTWHRTWFAVEGSRK